MSFTSKLLRSAWTANRVERAVRNPARYREATGEVEGDEQRRFLEGLAPLVACPVPTSVDNGRRSPRKLLRAVVAGMIGRKS
jgi:hypothetical protein